MGITRFIETLFHSCLMCILLFLCQVPLSTATEDLANITRAGMFVDGDISHVLLAQQPVLILFCPPNLSVNPWEQVTSTVLSFFFFFF